MTSDARRAWVSRLRPRGEVALDDALSQRDTLDQAVAGIGAEPVRWALELNAAVVQQILTAVPALGGGREVVDALRRANETTTLNALLTLADVRAPTAGLDEATAEEFRDFVHRAVPLDQVLRGVRVGHAATTEAFLRACADLVETEHAAAEAHAVSRDLFRFVDGLADAMVRTYLVEHRLWTTSAAAARADTVRSLLSDGPEPDVAEASRVLDHDLRRTHLAAVIWSDPPHGSSTMQTAAAEALGVLGAAATLVVPVSSGRLWTWGVVSSGPGRPPEDWAAAARALTRHGVSGAFGTPARGVVGFRRSYAQAAAAAQVESLRRDAGRAPRPATVYADVAVVALLATDLPAAGAHVRDVLGALAARTPAMQDLRTTLHYYLAAERSTAEVARRMHIARGTVTYRVNRAKELLAADLDGRRLALQTALALAEELGDAVLLPATDA